MIHRKCIAALISIAIVSVFWAGCELTVNEPIRNVPIFEPYISVQPSSYVFNVAEYNAPALKIEIVEWDKKEGSLSYQWYKFNTLEAFYKDQTEKIAGATGSSYTPSITPAAGKTFYYYVEVTNTNPDAIGDKSATVRSDVAAISFNTDGKPATPVISQNPVNASYTMGRTAAIAALDVRATAASGSLTYQWYKLSLVSGRFPDNAFNTDGTPNGTAITGATQRTYLPDHLSDLASGNNYYYVVVSNVTVNPDGTVLNRTDTVSIPAVITMELGEKAAPPRIDAQPKDILYFNGDDISTSPRVLSVGAVSLDRGALGYQWYSSAVSTGANATVVSGATDADYKPPKEAKFYYVVVTNTNNDVTGNKTETLMSKVAGVRLQDSGTLAKNATITVDPSRKQQYIRGYGGMETTWGNFFQSNEQDMENMFNPNILGYNIWRIMIPPIDTDIEKGMADITSRSYANRYYENVKIVNKYNGYVLASPWSPPKEWKSNNSINSGGHLVYTYRKQFANYLRSYARHMASKGAPVYAVSIANEPNYAGGYDGCEWTPEEMRDFFKEVGRYTQGVRGYGGGKATPTVLTVNGESANNPNINEAAMNDSVSNAAIDLFARHIYGDREKRMWDYPNLKGREVWMTEHNINSASAPAFPNDWTWNYIWRFMNDIDLVIRLNNENAFVWWVVKRFYSFIGENDAGTVEHTILPRGWGMAHYSKFSIDTIRIPVNVSGTLTDSGGVSRPIVCNTTDSFNASDTSNVNNSNASQSTNNHMDNTSVKVTAFISQDGNELSLVMWTPTLNDGAGGYALGNAEITMPEGFTIRSASAMRSRSSGGGGSGSVENMGKTEDVTIAADRKSAFINLPRSQILSVKFIKD